jgi:hypothetical protein
LYVKYSNCGANVVIFLIYTLGGAILLLGGSNVRAKQIKFCASKRQKQWAGVDPAH